LGWAVSEGLSDEGLPASRLELANGDGAYSILMTMEGIADRVVASPTGDGFYIRLQVEGRPEPATLLFTSGEPDSGKPLAEVSRHYCHFRHPRFAVTTDNQSLYYGHRGGLWRISLGDGNRVPIEFKAKVRMEIRDPVDPPKLADVGEAIDEVTSILDPRLSPNGDVLVFGALGYLWQQATAGGMAHRLTDGQAFERYPAFSPDGKRLAFVHGEHGTQEIRVLDLESGKGRTIASGNYFLHPSWHPDGQTVVFVEMDSSSEQYPIFLVAAVDLKSGEEKTLARGGKMFSPRPHFTSDGNSLLYRNDSSGFAKINQLALAESAEPEPVVQLAGHLGNVLISPDGHWIAFRRNTELWVVPLAQHGKGPIAEESGRRISWEGGKNFAFTPDGLSLIYAERGRVWKHPLTGGKRVEIPIQLRLDPPKPAPLLVRGVRPLDFESGGFSRETSLLIEDGRIRWMGSETDHRISPDTQILEAKGRFAIPGLINLHDHVDSPWRGIDVNQAAFVAYGVTSVRDMGHSLAWLTALRDRSRGTADPVPRYFFAGDYLGTYANYNAEGIFLLFDEADVRTYVRYLKEAGAQLVKHSSWLEWPLQRVAVEEARSVGLPVAAHAMVVQDAVRGATHGFTYLEHNAAPSRYYDDVYQLYAAAGTRWTPTLSIMGGTSFLFVREPGRSTDPKYCAFFPKSCGRKLPAPDSPRGRRREQRMLNAHAEIRAARARGVRLLLGSDNPFRPGLMMHVEMESFVLAGLSPLEVIRLATKEAAVELGAGDDLGTLEPGKLADLILLDANPLEDIKNTQTIWRVIKGGWLFDPEKLRPPESTSTTK
jgi:imidazolonepropionase-like amidohydrolase